jgi:transcriptional regulator with XRE-family HTH domain
MVNKDSHLAKDSIENFIRNSRLKMGQNIREIREKRGYSQDELAEIMGVNRSTISKIENGKFSFSIDYLTKFSLFLDFNFSIVDNQVI